MAMEVFRIIRSLDNLHTIRQGYGAQMTVTSQDIYMSRKDNLAPIPPKTWPAAFLFDGSAKIPITVKGAYRFPTAPGKYRLVGRIPNANGFTICSEDFDATGDGKMNIFSATEFRHINTVSASPFRIYGQATWSLVNAKTNNEVAKTTLNLATDLYFFLSNDTMAGTQYPLHYIDLIRLSVPPYDLVSGRSWNAVEADVVQNLANNLWDLAGNCVRFYDIKGGRSGHLKWDSATKTNSFNLRSFMQRAPAWCNCFDLAAMVNMLCLSLGRCLVAGQQIDVIDSFMIADDPWGYVNTGVLYGYDMHPTRRCNSPFWAKTGTYWFNNLADRRRTSFCRHCYVLFTSRRSPSPELVIDVCQCPINQFDQTVPHGGTLRRSDFRLNYIDQGGFLSQQMANLQSVITYPKVSQILG